MPTPENEALTVRNQSLIVVNNGIEKTEVYDAEWEEVRHYIPSAPSFGTKELHDLGCEYDKDKDQWYHEDPDIAMQAEELMRERAQSRRLSELERLAKEVGHEM